MNERISATVRGAVQGVGFRWFVRREADRLGVVGWAANQEDGSVSVVAEGETEALNRLVEKLRRGPSGARVDSLDLQRTQATGEFASFEIRARGHAGD